MAGKAWLEAFTEDSPWLEIKRYRENETFRFGNGPVYKSNLGYIIPATIGNLKTELKVSVVEANVLLGLDFQQEFSVVIDTGRQTLYIKASGEEFDMGQQRNHWRLPLYILYFHAWLEQCTIHEVPNMSPGRLRYYSWSLTASS